MATGARIGSAARDVTVVTLDSNGPVQRVRDSASAATWREVSRSDAAEWNQRLLETNASLFQYPYWNERHRTWMSEPRFVVYGPPDKPEAFLCLLSLGWKFLRIGLVQDGPVSLTEARCVHGGAMDALRVWLKAEHYVFVRIIHPDADFLKSLEDRNWVERVNAFPFYSAPRSELLVVQEESDERMLAGFQEIARRELRKAIGAGFTIQSSDRVEDLTAAWPLFMTHARYKGISYRSREVYASLMQAAQRYGCVQLFTAWLDRNMVGALLVFRDRDTAVPYMAAVDFEALGRRPSPSVLLHWTAMRAFARKGARFYNFGTRFRSSYEFKRKFRPVERVRPVPAVLILRKTLYRVWRSTVLRINPGTIRLSRILRILTRSKNHPHE
jgi:hypothetical protein